MEDFLVIVVKTLKNDKIPLRFVDANNINDLIFVCYLERQDLLANLAVYFVKLEHYLTLVHLSLTFCFQPGTQTLQVNSALCSSALAW